MEQNVFNSTTLSFDDNKVFEIQLDMLIFVQVYMTIDKNLCQDIGSDIDKREQWNLQRKLMLQDRV